MSYQNEHPEDFATQDEQWQEEQEFKHAEDLQKEYANSPLSYAVEKTLEAMGLHT